MLSIDRSSIASQVYDELLQQVLDGSLAPRQRLDVNDLARRFGISRTPVRQALLRLQDLGFVEVLPYSSSAVADWSEKDMQERCTILGSLTMCAARNQLPLAVLDAIRSQYDDDVARYRALTHELLRSGFPRLSAALDESYAVPLFTYLSSPVPARDALGEERSRAHRITALEQALDALSVGDTAAASAALAAYANLLSEALECNTPVGTDARLPVRG